LSDWVNDAESRYGVFHQCELSNVSASVDNLHGFTLV
jgi:hypothetical protein